MSRDYFSIQKSKYTGNSRSGGWKIEGKCLTWWKLCNTYSPALSCPSAAQSDLTVGTKPSGHSSVKSASSVIIIHSNKYPSITALVNQRSSYLSTSVYHSEMMTMTMMTAARMITTVRVMIVKMVRRTKKTCLCLTLDESAVEASMSPKSKPVRW